MTTRKQPKKRPDFDKGERAALVILEELEINHRWVKDGLQLRFGKRGRLTPPEPNLGVAIMALIDEGPHSRTSELMLELHLAAALALTDEPETDVFAYVDDVLDLATCSDVATDDDPPPKSGIVLPFPSKRNRK